MDKISAQKRYNFDIMFVGSDWKGTEKWNKIEADMKKINVSNTDKDKNINNQSK